MTAAARGAAVYTNLLRGVECDRVWREDECRWTARLTDDHEVVVFWPQRDGREFSDGPPLTDFRAAAEWPSTCTGNRFLQTVYSTYRLVVTSGDESYRCKLRHQHEMDSTRWPIP
jgi:hypothetical protein